MRSPNKELRAACLRSILEAYFGMDRLVSSSISILRTAIIIG